MIEIVFSDSACGSLKVEKGRLLMERANPMDGTPDDILGFTLALSVGDISEHEPGIRRQQELERLYSVYPNNIGHEAAHELLLLAKDNLKTVCARAAKEESLRIWYSNKPDELCGLFWLMAQLNSLEANYGQVSLVELPDWEIDENGTIVRYVGWGEVQPGEWHKYLALQRPAPPIFCKSCAFHWQALQKENAPLRAMLNGQLVSAPETLYDDFIIREIEAENITFHEAMVIGRVLGKYQLGIGDAWVALRIEEMISAGKLEAVTVAAEDAPRYHRLLRKLFV
ncbi:DUF3658 domain-containing protein [Oscillospiraceae bacterium WX1]